MSSKSGGLNPGDAWWYGGDMSSDGAPVPTPGWVEQMNEWQNSLTRQWAKQARETARERRVRSVWGNLSIEHPDVTLEDVRKALEQVE
jgi:hypothetical protein